MLDSVFFCHYDDKGPLKLLQESRLSSPVVGLRREVILMRKVIVLSLLVVALAVGAMAISSIILCPIDGEAMQYVGMDTNPTTHTTTCYYAHDHMIPGGGSVRHTATTNCKE
jgi:hypothetical protein